MVPGGLLVWQLAPPLLAVAAGQPRWWPAAFALAAGVNLWGWLAALRKRNAMLDTPTSRVASAAQGYVELIGAGRPLDGVQLLTPHTQLPCLWYRYRVERRQRDEWRRVDSGESELSFGLDDGSGLCRLDPRGAEILTTHVEVRVEGELRYTEEVLLKDDRLYALGLFQSLSPDPGERRRQVGEILGEWKQDRQALHDRFDRDRDGRIDPAEWDRARREAESEAARAEAAAPRHVLVHPGGGRPYLIGNHAPERLGRRFGRLAWLHLALLVAMTAAAGWAWDRLVSS